MRIASNHRTSAPPTLSERLEEFLLYYGRRAEELAGFYPCMLQVRRRKTEVAEKWYKWEKEAHLAKLRENEIRAAVMQYRNDSKKGSSRLFGQIKRARFYIDVQAAKDAYGKFRTQVLEEATQLQQRVVANTNETLYAEWQRDNCGALNPLPQPEKKARFWGRVIGFCGGAFRV